MTKTEFLDDAKLVDWAKLTTDFIKPQIEEALESAQADIDSISALRPEEVTFDNTFLALENAGESLERAWGRVGHLTSVKDSKELRDVYNELLPKVTEYHTRIPLNPDLWNALKAFVEKPEAVALRGIRKRFFDETIKDFQEAGADLPAAEKKRLEALNSELAQKTQKFSENVLDATNAYELIVEDESRLAGLPDSAKQAAAQSARQKDLGSDEKPVWRFTLHAPSIMPFLKFAEDGQLRKEIWTASSKVGKEGDQDNTDLIRDILKLRKEKADILGKDNFADHVLKRRMAKSGRQALDFVEDLHGKTRDAFREEIEELEAFVAKEVGEDPESLEPWSLAYWSEKLRKSRYDFYEEELRPYFPLNKVMSGMFGIVEKLFGVKILECPEAATPWHEEVTVFRLEDASGELLGYFYADWHPREEKRGGAWMNYLDTGMPARDGHSNREPHVGLICGNLTAPVGDNPALLTHYEVETIFHEFGHLLHHLLGDVEIKSLNGVNVAWDFVELPSQIMENWCWNKESLDVFARHYKTDEPIPEGLFAKMKAARNFQSAMGMMRQLSFGKMDLEMHLHPENYYEGDLEQKVRSVIKDYILRTKTPSGVIAHKFSHLFSSSVGYAAAYYSYKWAEVLDADAFTRFEKEGIFNVDTGKAFRENILSKGNSEDPMALFKSFMNREPDPEALLKRSGLVS